MARNDVYLNINALSPADAVVTGQQDMTAATVPELVLGDTPTFNFLFTDNTNVWPSWAGNASYSLTWALSDAVAGDFSPAATTGNATPITGGWSVVLPLNSYDLVGLLNTKRVGQPYPVTNLWQQLRVTDPSGNEITRAMFWTPVRYRAISDTQNTESASPTGGRFVTVNNVNTLTTPTAAQFYAANPVPTSALGTAANGELLIGNGTGFTKSTLTAGTGITVTNGSGSITIDASGAQETLTATVKNAESVAITKGQVVYLFGATGGFASVKLAYNTSDATSAKTFGVVSSTSIAANGTGTVTCVGVVDGLNLGAYNDGDTLYLGATPGSVTATKPYAPNHLVYVGIVERANNGNGELYVRVQNGYELDEIHDVQINAPKLAGQTLIYDQTNDLWKNARLTGTANQITVTNADAAVTLSIPTNPTLPGNLTVSGTGTSTFGGNLTVSGTGTSSFAGPVTGTSSTNGYQWTLTGSGVGGPTLALDATNATVANRYSGLGLLSGGTFQWGLQIRAGDGKFHIYDGVRTVSALTVDVGPLSGVAGTTTVGGNLTVNGFGTSSFAGVLQFAPDVWQRSGSTDRLYFSSAADRITYLKGGPAAGTGTAVTIRNGADATVASFSGNGDTSVTGNLTVSGTGNSSVAGSLGIGTTTTEGGSLLHLVKSSAGGEGSFLFLDNPAASTLGSKAGIKFATSSGSSFAASPTGEITNVITNSGTGASALDFGTFDGSASAIRMRLSATGNLLLGTTTDSGNGKLQLATHTTSAGGIGFGTDTSAFATSAGFLAIRGIGNNQSGVFEFQYTNGAGTPVTGAGYVGVAGSAGTLATGTAIGDVVLRGAGAVKVASGGGTTALTLDSTQRALFTGDVILNKTGSDPMLYSGGGRGLMFGTNAGDIVLTLDTSKNATFAGNALISHATGNNSKLSVIKNTAPALNHIAQVVLGQGVGGGFGANDRTYQLVNNGESSTAAYFGVQYWDGSNYNLRLKIDSAGDATFAGKITATSSSQGILSLTGSSNLGTNIRLKNTGTNGRDWGINSNVTLGQGEFSLYDYTAGYESFRITGTSTGTVTIYPTGGLVVENGPIKTAAPSGGTAATWRLGTVASVSPTSPNRTIEVEIGGTTYYIHAKTTNN